MTVTDPPATPPLAAPAAADAKAAATAPRRFSRRTLLRGIAGGAAVCLVGGTYASQIEPFWIDQHDVSMPVRGLPNAFAGFRIVQLTDLHASDSMPISYLASVVDRVNQLKPDLVVVTGDLVTHSLDWVKPVCEVLAKLAPQTLVTFGNHDYDVSGWRPGGSTQIADALEAALALPHFTVLRNRAIAVERGGGRVWFVGLEDLWSGRFEPHVAFAGLDMNEPVIALSHNPDTAPTLDAFGVQWTLSGHTHGGQVRIPGMGAILLNVQNRQFEQGLIQLPSSKLYVSRGVGYLIRARVFCRPELPCFVMSPAV